MLDNLRRYGFIRIRNFVQLANAGLRTKEQIRGSVGFVDAPVFASLLIERLHEEVP